MTAAASIPKLFYLLPAVFVLVGGGVAFSALYGQLLRIRAEKWPVTTATILSVDKEVSRGSRRSSVTIKTTYAYEVNGTEYEGKKIHPTYGGSSHFGAHEALKEALEPGRKVQVKYCPKNPAQAFLATAFRSGSLAMLAVGMMFLGAGLGFGCLMWIATNGNYDYASLIRPA